jgi:hypothetical protein
MENIKIRMALGINENACLFMKHEEKGLFLGNRKYYKTIGTYTGNDLIKLCDNEDGYIFHSIFDILTKADNDKQKNKLKEIYFKLQKN